MIQIVRCSEGGAVVDYAARELCRLLRRMTREKVVVCPDARVDSRVTFDLSLDTSLVEGAIAIDSDGSRVQLRGGSPEAVLHAVYTFCERLGCVFESSCEVVPPSRPRLEFPAMTMRHTPSVRERGIRMHLNFVQDQSFFTESEFKGFIDNMARQRFNYLAFHMYTPQQWFPFSYRGVEHLDLSLGNLNRKPLSPGMIGRSKIKVQDHWFPREFETISNGRSLLEAVYERYKKMMAHAHARGIRNSVSMEPESMPPALTAKLAEWTAGDALPASGVDDLTKNWQEEWSGVKLTEPDLRHPLVVDIAVERVLQCIDAFPDLDELQLISREGVAWRPREGQAVDVELTRLKEKFGLANDLFDLPGLAHKVAAGPCPAMNPKAHPYWTVLPGDCYYPTVIGSLRFVEFALAILGDKRVQAKVRERRLETSVAIYSPNPGTIRLMMPAVAKMLPAGTRFHCLADYGARDISENLPAWRPLSDAGQRIGVISWLEFDGTMMLAQGWMDALAENIRRSVELGAETVYFNHWRVRGLEHNAAAAAALCWDVRQESTFRQDYFSRLFGSQGVSQASVAYRCLEQATLYAKSYNYNIGFTHDWVFKHSTDVPGYYWRRLQQSQENYAMAASEFTRLVGRTTGPGRRQAAYLRDLCRVSALHIQAVSHLQNAKLPLMGYKAWPLDNPEAAWPPPHMLKLLAREARQALSLEMKYMRIYSRWVRTCDEQGQLALHHQGVIEPFMTFVEDLKGRLVLESTPLRTESKSVCVAT